MTGSIKGPTVAEQRVGDAIEKAWDEAEWGGSEGGGGLPPIDFTPDEKHYLARAAIAAMEATRTATNRAAEGEKASIVRLLMDDNQPHAPALSEHAANWLAGRIAALSAKPDPEPTRTELVEMLHRVSDRVRGGLTVDAGMVGAIDALLSRAQSGGGSSATRAEGEGS